MPAQLLTQARAAEEALNEHILGDAWPSADIRLEMLEEAIDVIRQLHQGGFTGGSCPRCCPVLGISNKRPRS